ncbi:hypothetical protein N7448_006761 [Penicillium atrosanguineum]|uniref:Uncharacterized protein n=1 Tax=Penicillium atrosanguineum TaxID=1132637 RepID=A0A9W9U1Z9_9EURO|nr:uncharacterized protein N7443_010522 [Penicillium atrosanguineum]KAJ5132603.1 hypothetical protein N7448_006761 [Penicillium atrosanguineum]KAJ5290269.1 hypothetical protein N7443_010522 [Penicillium atrosanguineum]KAJ5308092.1 hypothetical protein N7476_008748 [Penicillium atrosanguineum]
MTSFNSHNSTARVVPKIVNSQADTTPNFADPNFDPAEFLNDSLSPLTVASLQPNASRAPGSVPLTELSAQVQSLLSQISAQNVRLSSTLSQLSDEILRSGGRLAYEVEVLRGETIGLSETLTEVLRDDIAKFVPESSKSNTIATSRKTESVQEGAEDPTSTKEEGVAAEEQQDEGPADPEYITNLRTLNQVRSRLEDVVQTFGDAMEWPLPPSEVSFSSSFISVSGPEMGPEGQDQEQKGQESMKKLRNEILELLESQGGGHKGLEAATQRLETLRTLAAVWKGSAEEKARARFVDALGRIVDERRRVLEHQQAMAEQSQRGPRSREQRRDSDSGAPAGGLFRNLQRLREEIYLE